MAVPPVTPSLPLSQQIIAWALPALGYGEASGVSRGTLKNARSGKPIPEMWPVLVGSMLRRLGVESPPVELLDSVQEGLRQWDLVVGRLPSATELSLAERLHAPLTCFIPAVGIRLGALAAFVSLATQTPVGKWEWIVEPLDKCFFGNVVHALFLHRYPGWTNEDRKGLLEDHNRDEEEKIVDWRTIERWRSGATGIPNGKGLAALAEELGEGAEAMLRAARLAAVLREDLRDWIGAQATAEWAGAVAYVGRTTARLLSAPGEVASLLRQLREGLEASGGDGLYAILREQLPGAAKELARSDLAERLGAAAERIEAEGKLDHPAARWIIGCSVLVPYPHLEVRVWSALGGNPLGYVATKNLDGHIRRDWMLRGLMKAVARGGTLSFTRADGSPVERQISSATQDVAQRWGMVNLRFGPLEDDPVVEYGLSAVLFEVFGPECFPKGDGDGPPPVDLLGMLLDPVAEVGLPDDPVRSSVPLSLARARRLLKDGDWDGAFRWIPDLRTLHRPLGEPVITGLMETYAAIAHHVIDQPRRLRLLYRAALTSSDRDQAREPLLGAVRLGEQLVMQIIELGRAPEGSLSLLESLVHALPAAVRIMLLREELECAQEGLTPAVVERLVLQLAECMEHHATHGYGWALLALWFGLHGQGKEEQHAKKQATHFGADAFLESEWIRILDDLDDDGEAAGLAQDAG